MVYHMNHLEASIKTTRENSKELDKGMELPCNYLQWSVQKLFNILYTLKLCNVISTPIAGSDMHIVGSAYVDNSDLFAWDDKHNVEKIVEKCMQ